MTSQLLQTYFFPNFYLKKKQANKKPNKKQKQKANHKPNVNTLEMIQYDLCQMVCSMP